MKNESQSGSSADMQALIEKFGRPMKPRELAEILGVDARTVRRYYRRWGGVEVCPGTVRFFENRACELLEQGIYAEPDNEAGKGSVCGQCGCNKTKEHGKTSLEQQQKRQLGRGPRKGSGKKKKPQAETVKKDRHGVFSQQG